LIVIPFEHGDLVPAVDFGEGVNDVCTEEWIDVFGEELCTRWSILCPVGVVTNSVIGITARRQSHQGYQ